MLFLLSLTIPSSHQSNLVGNQLTIIPSELCNLTSLRELCDNHFSLQCLLLFILFLLSLTIPSSHQSLLESNRLTSIPPELGNLSSLVKLCDNTFIISYYSLLLILYLYLTITPSHQSNLIGNQLTSLPFDLANLSSLLSKVPIS